MSATTTVIEPVAPDAIHQPFTWLHPQIKHDQHAQFIALTMDVCNGIQTCLGLVQATEISRDSGTPPLLKIGDTSALLRLAIVSAQMLGEKANDRIEQTEDRAVARAIKESK